VALNIQATKPTIIVAFIADMMAGHPLAYHDARWLVPPGLSSTRCARYGTILVEPGGIDVTLTSVVLLIESDALVRKASFGSSLPLSLEFY
jgi:hypothetical protein